MDEPFVDMHVHALYGMDDGAGTQRAALAMLERAAVDGVGTMILTPHARPGLCPFNGREYVRRLGVLRRLCAEWGLNVALFGGAEILCTEMAARFLAEGRIPTMNGTRRVLLEWHGDASVDEIERGLRNVGNSGFLPIIAHVERYAALYMDRKRLERLRETYGAQVQIDCEAVLDRWPLLRRRAVFALIREEMVEYVASDAHDTQRRRSRMREAAQLIGDRFGEETARRLMRGNARRYLNV